MGKKEKIKIYLQYPWKASECAYYTYLLTDSPNEIEYVTSKQEGGVIENKKKMMFYRNFKKNIKRILKKLGITFVNLKKVNTKQNFDLIHGAHCLINSKKPWVADFEYVSQVTFPMNKKRNKKVIKILKKESCKKILPWTDWAREAILKTYPELKNKIETVYPGIPERDRKSVV